MKVELHDVGMTFPLYKAPLDTISGLVKKGKCVTCGQSRKYLFELSQNDFVVDPCTKCGEPLGLQLGWPNEKPVPSTCERCSTISHWPKDRPREGIAVCYECLRGGKA